MANSAFIKHTSGQVLESKILTNCFECV